MWCVTSIISLCLIVYLFFKYRFGFWKRLNVPQIDPSIPFGDYSKVFRAVNSAGVQTAEYYRHLKDRNHKHGGLYMATQPVYLPIDPKLIKHVLTKDFQHFVEKDFYINERDQPVSAHLFAIGGEKWKTLRQKLTPTFTSGKMKMMFDTVEKCRHPMLNELQESASNKQPIDVKDIAAKFTTDIIGSVAFGIECNSFKNPDSEFRKYGKDIFYMNLYRTAKLFFAVSYQSVGRFLGICPFSTESNDFFFKIVRETIDYREAKGVIRNDVMQLLINLMNKGSVDGDESNGKNKITFDEVVAQAFVFFAAGFETSSTTTTFVMLELAQHQDLQDKVRQEIHDVLKKHDGKITYEALNDLVYMKQVIDEALRKYPPLPTVDRRCTKDYTIPGTDIVLPAGTPTTVSVLGLQRDPEYFPDPLRFDPDRFSKENINKITDYTYLPFGEGPRVCIGLRFGIMQTKVGLITLLKDFKYTLNHRTNPNVEYDATFILTVKNDVYLDVEAINK